jgi:hypothetical protein
MDILEGSLFLLMPHELLERRNAHLFIGFMGAEGVYTDQKVACLQGIAPISAYMYAKEEKYTNGNII